MAPHEPGASGHVCWWRPPMGVFDDHPSTALSETLLGEFADYGGPTTPPFRTPNETLSKMRSEVKDAMIGTLSLLHCECKTAGYSGSLRETLPTNHYGQPGVLHSLRVVGASARYHRGQVFEPVNKRSSCIHKEAVSNGEQRSYVDNPRAAGGNS